MLVRRIIQLLAGLSLFGFSIAVLIKAGLGISPWDIFHQGLGRLTGISTGMVIIAVSFLVLLLWIPLRMRPGWGTLANAVLIGAFVDLSIPLIPQANGLLWQVVYLAGGLVLLAVGSACYLGASFGPGARDGLMTGLAQRTGWSIRTCRTLIEVTVAAAGWLLGGTLGIGTVAEAFLIGPLIQWLMPLFSVPSGPREPSPDNPLSKSAAS
ncbi:hypothetical protein WBN73_09015 [Paenarthrobacter sp. CCNWLY172]|uniref:membrane protein YczE n=1 Tax=Micrococcaceae TaxID=1268 RepID=UPI001A98ACE1|nr:hypothetical protein [Arthrobacter sp. D5-1]QSZ47083.1 hypothetical protein AYX22_00720 [Arthrobacter sp. D5-1]